MALYSSRGVCLYSLRLLSLKKKTPFLCSSIHQSVKDDTGVLDEFTTQLMQRKSNKWERRKALVEKKLKSQVLIKNNTINTAENLAIDDINELFQRAFDYDDSSAVIKLTKQCVRYDKMPSLDILMYALSLCSREGDINTIKEVSQLCQKVKPEILDQNSKFEHFIAEAVWVKGNVEKSLKIFEEVYNENIYLRRSIRFILKRLILNSVANHSEATVVNLIQFSDMLVKEYNDYFPLGCLWQACILSEWFTDQQIAIDLLDNYTGLCPVIVNKIPFIVRISLRHHRTEVVYRLTEALLKLKMESEVAQVLLALFDYWIKQGDFRQCREIVLWSIQNDIEITTIIHNERLVKLFEKDIKDIRTKLKSHSPKRIPRDYKF